MSRPTGSNVEICLGNFAVGVVGKLRIETSSFVFVRGLWRLIRASAATPSTTPHPNQSQKVTPKNVFSNKVCLEGIQMRVINLRSLPSKFSQRSKKSRNFPKFVKHSSATPWRSRLNRVKSTSVFFMTSTSNPQVQYSLSTAVSVSICVHFILCFSVFRFDENVPYLAFHIPPSKSQCLICGKIFSV